MTPPNLAAAVHTQRVTLSSPSTAAEGAAPWLECRIAGPEGGPLLVFLHGFPEAAFVWDDLLGYFGSPAGGGYRCVAPNLRGYAGSFAPAEVKAYRAHEMLGDLVSLIEAHGGQAAALIAHDWGGALAWGFAALAPQLISKLIILNAPHPGLFLNALRDDPAQQQASAYMNELRRPDAESRLSADDFAGMWPFFERFGGATWLTPELRDQYRAVWSAVPSAPPGVTPAPHALTGPLNYYRASPLHPPLEAADPVNHLQLPEALLHIRIPTRVIWGEADTALPPSLLDGLPNYVADLHITRLPGLSHWLVHEDPAAVRSALVAALDR